MDARLNETYSAILEGIHEKAQEYLFFERLSKHKRNQFFGATDALFDTNINASDYSVGFRSAPRAGILLCYGFLQVLYVQQDAVKTLADTLDIPWKPEYDPELEKIRDVRNRFVWSSC
jgi:hypothetical protein